jgi:hypothetical protein
MVFQRIAASVGIALIVVAGLWTLGTLGMQVTSPEFAATFVLSIAFLAFFVAVGTRGARTTTTEYW